MYICYPLKIFHIFGEVFPKMPLVCKKKFSENDLTV